MQLLLKKTALVYIKTVLTYFSIKKPTTNFLTVAFKLNNLQVKCPVI